MNSLIQSDDYFVDLILEISLTKIVDPRFMGLSLTNMRHLSVGGYSTLPEAQQHASRIRDSINRSIVLCSLASYGPSFSHLGQGIGIEKGFVVVEGVKRSRFENVQQQVIPKQSWMCLVDLPQFLFLEIQGHFESGALDVLAKERA